MDTARTDVELRRAPIDGPLVMVPRLHGDERGFFRETFRRSTLSGLGIDSDWVQENHSRSARGVLRGMHLQLGEGQAKLVRCARGSIFDVVVDVRRGSPTWGQWAAFDLDGDEGAVLYVPVGFAHGFCVTSDVADVIYSCSAYYDPAAERTIAYDDPELAIRWPELELTVSPRDASAPPLAELADEIPFAYAR